MKSKAALTLSTLALAFLLSASSAAAQTTAFTYQGRLTDSGSPANGNYDLQFTLWNAFTGGTQQPQPTPVTVTKTSVAVANGVFTVQIDFGASALPGADRFLEISGRPTGGASFTTLSPRQQISSTPYAIRTLNSGSADGLSSACVGCVQDSQINQVAGSKVNGPIPLASVPSGNSNYIQNSTTQQSGSNFNISGDGIAGGTISGNAFISATTYNIGGLTMLRTGAIDSTFVAGGGNLSSTGQYNTFVGVGAGGGTTTGGNNVALGVGAGLGNIGGYNNTFIGRSSGGDTSTEGTFVGSAARPSQANLTNATAIGANAIVSQNNSLVLGSINGVGGANASTNVGIGTTAPGAKLNIADQTTAEMIRLQGPAAGGSDITFNVDPASATGGTIGYSPGDIPGSPATPAVFLYAGLGAGVSLHAGGSSPGALNVLPNQNVGIGTPAPVGRLNVVGSGGQGTGIQIDNREIKFRGDGIAHFSIFANRVPGALTFEDTSASSAMNTPGNPLMVISNTGNVGLGGVSSPTSKLQVNGQARFSTVNIDSYVSGQNLSLCTTNTGGNQNIVGLCSSSLRYKTNVQSFRRGLEILTGLQPISFDWKAAGTHDVGLAAEDVAKVEPLLTFRNDKGEIEGVKYNQLSAVFINAFKEQQAQIGAQQEQLKRQEEQIQRQEQQARQQRAAFAAQQQQLNALKALVCRSHHRASVCK